MTATQRGVDLNGMAEFRPFRLINIACIAHRKFGHYTAVTPATRKGLIF